MRDPDDQRGDRAGDGQGHRRQHAAVLSPYLLYGLVGLLVLANVINIGADLGAMAAALQLILPGPQWLYVAAFAILIVLLEVFMRYGSYVSVLRWLTLSLLAYVATVFVVGVPWGTVAYHLVVPHVEWTAAYFTMVVAIFGTTISPYLFFWQASEEVEDVKEDPAASQSSKRPLKGPGSLKRIRLDTMVGMGASNVVALFIVLTTAATLHAHGVTNVETWADAAKALKPIAGNLAFVVFALGIVGTGLIAVPVLAGSAAYALGETLGWRIGSRSARAGRRLLSGDCRRDARGGAPQFFAARSDQGADLQRHRQRRRCSSHHDPDHAHGLAAGGHGGLRPETLAQDARLAGDGGHDRGGGRHVRHLERLNRTVNHPRQTNKRA